MSAKPHPPLTPEALVPRLGEQLVNMGLLTTVQQQQALAYQQKSVAEGRPCLLGQAIMELGFLDRPTLDHAVTEQILRLRAALEDANRHLEQRVQQRTAELEEALRKLAEINQLKTNFVSNVSHELRTPLTHIRGYLELLFTQSLGDLNDDQLKALEVSLKSADRLQNLISDLILFSQAARGTMTLVLKPTDLTKAVSEALASSQPKADEKRVNLRVKMEAGLPRVKADEEKIGWVIAQLLDNAIKFTPVGGEVQLHLALENKNMVVISVLDSGIGIHPEKVDEIFEPFHQLDSSSTRRYGGTGLGLTLVREIVEAHGSLVTLKSQVGQGTIIRFPLLMAGSEE